jgi:hypothetical protein
MISVSLAPTKSVIVQLNLISLESIFLMVATAVYGLLDMWRESYGDVSPFITCSLWAIALLVPRYIPSLKAIAQRPIPPLQVLQIGNMSFAMPSYYNLILAALSGALGFYYIIQDSHRYIVTTSLLVLGILLPFAVRMYRTRMTVDSMNNWRNGIDDMGVFYLVASVFAGLDLFRTFMFRSDSVMYWAVSVTTRYCALLFTLLVVMEACLLGCSTRSQIVAVVLPIVLLVAACP